MKNIKNYLFKELGHKYDAIGGPPHYVLFFANLTSYMEGKGIVNCSDHMLFFSFTWNLK